MTEPNSQKCKQSPKKVPIYTNVIWMLVIVEIAILLMFGFDGVMALCATDNENVTYESFSDHIINLQMIAVGGAVAMFERLIPARSKESENGD
ncbi:MAG: hypothetical protein OXG08_13900 [Gammaproteobacteria bacterium]|nr:hypothetical protein [Gammaproteobacteria bacterium]